MVGPKTLVLALLLPTFGGTALAADLDDGLPASPPVAPAPVVEPIPVPVPVAALLPVAVPVPVGVPVPVAVPVFAPATVVVLPPPSDVASDLFSAPVAYYPPAPAIPSARDPARAEAQYYGYGVAHRRPRPLGYYPPEALD